MKRYIEIYLTLEKRIQQGLYQANQKLPSEAMFTKEFHVSRDTIRKAMNLLNDNGLIQKKQGRGAIVLSRKQINFPVSGLTSYKELQGLQQFESETKVVLLSLSPLSKEEAERTGFEEGQYIWHLLRVRKMEGKAVVLDEDFILARNIPALTLEIAENSIYEYFEQEVGLEIAYAEKEITIEPLIELDKKYLDLTKQDIHVVSVKSHTYLSDTTYFQYTESRHQVDKFRFVDFARRNPSLEKEARLGRSVV